MRTALIGQSLHASKNVDSDQGPSADPRLPQGGSEAPRTEDFTGVTPPVPGRADGTEDVPTSPRPTRRVSI